MTEKNKASKPNKKQIGRYTKDVTSARRAEILQKLKIVGNANFNITKFAKEHKVTNGTIQNDLKIIGSEFIAIKKEPIHIFAALDQAMSTCLIILNDPTKTSFERLRAITSLCIVIKTEQESMERFGITPKVPDVVQIESKSLNLHFLKIAKDAANEPIENEKP